MGGKLERDEIKRFVRELHLPIREATFDALINLADFDGDGHINYAEFARILTEQDVLAMKGTLSAVANAHKLGLGDRIIPDEKTNYADLGCMSMANAMKLQS